ncbi:MAG: nucleotidyl transferase AbiEii/AbiGii toxin family protein [Thermoleophilia bacterium]
MTEPLRPLRERLGREAERLSVPFDVVELDYALSYVLTAIAANEDLSDSLVFKGGTALHKAYFSDYRYSVDLDFTAVGGPRGAALQQRISEVAEGVAGLLEQYGPFTVTSSRRPERSAHPAGQEAFVIRVQFPWHRSISRSIKIEITVDEPLLLTRESRPLLHRYGEDLAVELWSYRLEEIVAEKLRTLLQAQKRVNEGKWARNCARDFYDLWYLCRLPEGALDRSAVVTILPAKCAVRGVSFAGATDFFPSLIVSEAERQWESSLADLVEVLPKFRTMIAELQESLRQVFGSRLPREDESGQGDG